MAGLFLTSNTTKEVKRLGLNVMEREKLVTDAQARVEAGSLSYCIVANTSFRMKLSQGRAWGLSYYMDITRYGNPG